MAKRQMQYDSIFDFGKHFGFPVHEIIEHDPKYFAWLIENDVVEFDRETMEALEQRKII